MHTVIINNREGLEVGQMPPKGRASSGVAILGDLVTLIPGLNLIPAEQHAEMMKNPAWASKFKTLIPRSLSPEQNPEKAGKPILEVGTFVGDKDKIGQVEDKHPLKHLKSEQCARMIEETLAVSMLKQWLQEENRPEIRLPLEKRIEELTTGAPATAASAGR